MRVSILLCSAIMSMILCAQNKELSLKSSITNAWSTLGPERLKQLQWHPDGNAVLFEAERDSKKVLIQKSLSGSERIFMTLSSLNSRMDLDSAQAFKTFPKINFYNDTSFYIRKGLKYYFTSSKLDKPLEIVLPEGSENADVHEGSIQIAYTKGDQLFIKNISGEKIEVSDGETDNIVFGKAVHRYEFGISKGTFWSPKGNYLAYYKKNEQMVSDYPLVDVTDRPAELNSIKYPMAGDSSHYVQIGILNVKSGKKIYLETGLPKDQYLTNIAWSPDEKSIYVAVLNRGQDHLKLQKYDVSTGKHLQTLFEEKDNEYVEPEHPPYFINGDASNFIWFSERDGYQHLYLYTVNGKLQKQITSGKWLVHSILSNDISGRYIYVKGSGKDARSTAIYKIDIKTGKRQLIGKNEGVTYAQFNQNGTHYISSYSSIDIPRIQSIVNNEGDEIFKLKVSKDPLEEYNIGKVEMLEFQADDGSTLFGRIIKPSNFDPNKKYPVWYYVYGGPHAQLVKNTWLGGASLWMYHMAEQGYVVFTLDNRGSGNRSLDFEQVIHRQLGQCEMKDQLIGVEYLKSLPYIDSTRMGVHGWSFGGFMTISLMLNYPGVFKLGVAGGPVIDWKYYEIMYTERYMDTPKENPEGYQRTSLLDKVNMLDGKLLIIHGTADDVVLWQHSLDFVKKAVEASKQLDYFVYPEHKHNVLGKDRVHLFQKIYDYFKANI